LVDTKPKELFHRYRILYLDSIGKKNNELELHGKFPADGVLLRGRESRGFAEGESGRRKRDRGFAGENRAVGGRQ
jgi:hypothetical protein